jgi:TRAP-type C4-dicarboxylate transport system substrate-binding protein
VDVDGTYEWRFAVSSSAQDQMTLLREEMIQRINERTNGAVTITLFPGGTLLEAAEVPTAVGSGTIEMEAFGVTVFGTVSRIASVMTPGFTGISTNDALRILEPGTEGRQIFDEEFARIGVKPLAFWSETDIGIVSYEPLDTLESFRGKKVRTSSEISAEVLRELGAEPVVMGGSEAVDAMARRIIDAGTCEPTCMFSRGYVDFVKYYNNWTAVPFVGMLTMNKELWDSLPGALQALLLEEAQILAEDTSQAALSSQGLAMWKAANDFGISLIAPSNEERLRLLDLSRPIMDEFVRNSSPQPQATRIWDLLQEAAGER